MDDTKDYVTINIRLTKGNYNRMWEIKVSIQLRYYTYLHFNKFSNRYLNIVNFFDFLSIYIPNKLLYFYNLDHTD